MIRDAWEDLPAWAYFAIVAAFLMLAWIAWLALGWPMLYFYILAAVLGGGVVVGLAKAVLFDGGI